MADKKLVGHVINVTGMIGVSAGIVLFAFGIGCSYFGGALALKLQTRFTGYGNWVAAWTAWRWFECRRGTPAAVVAGICHQ